MSIFKKVSQGLGGFFKTKDNLDALAILFEPKGTRVVEGKFGASDAVSADITIFNTKAQLAGEEEPVVMLNATITDTCPVRDLSAVIGEAALCTAGTVPNKHGGQPIAVINDVTDPATIEAVEEYVKKRQAKIEEETPEWMK